MRSMAKIAITIGGIPLPVRVYSLHEPKGTGLIQTHITDDHIGQVGRINYCKVCKQEVPYNEIQNGKKIGDNIIPIRKDELANIRPQSSKTFQIEGLWSREELSKTLLPLHIDAPYVLEPEDLGKKAYTLLRDALINQQKVAHGKITFRGREHLAIIMPLGNVLLLITLRYADEVRTHYLDQVAETLENVEPTDKETEMFNLMLQTLYPEDEEQPKLEDYKDEYLENIKKLIEAKINGQEYKVETKEPEPVEDLLAQMKAAIEQAKQTKKKKKKKVEAEAYA